MVSDAGIVGESCGVFGDHVRVDAASIRQICYGRHSGHGRNPTDRADSVDVNVQTVGSVAADDPKRAQQNQHLLDDGVGLSEFFEK